MNRDYPERPFIGVGVAVLRADAVLLIRRGKAPRRGQWSLPGGLQEVGETVFEAARREVREETAVEIDDLAVVDVIDSIQRDAAGAVEFHYTLVDLAARWTGGEAVAGSDAMHAEWIPFARIDGLGMWSETNRVIREGRRLLFADG